MGTLSSINFDEAGKPMMTCPDNDQPQVAATASCCAPPRLRRLPASEATRRARQLKALGHPVRLQILHLLTQAGDALCVCDIEAHFDLKQPTISHHLRWLKEAGFLAAEVRGTYTYYRLQPEALSGLTIWLQQLAT